MIDIGIQCLFLLPRALDRNEYNHITATYFLLAERKLRAQRQSGSKKTKGGDEQVHRGGDGEDTLIRGRTGSNPNSPKHKESGLADTSSIV